MKGALGVVALLLAASAACSTSNMSMNVRPGPGGTDPSLTKLIAAAELAPCPASSTTVVSGGLPNVTLPCLGNGPQVHLAGLTGKPMVVNTWGSWCTECGAEERYLSSAYDKDRGQVRFLGVDTVDEADSALDFDAHVTPPVHFPSIFDPNHKVELGLRVDCTPDTVFVSAAGHIVHSQCGPYLSTAQLQQDISTYLHVTT